MQKSLLALGLSLTAVLLLAAQQPDPASQQPSEVKLVIGGDGGRPPRYAVPDLVALNAAAGADAKTIGEVLRDDFAFEREFYLIERDIVSTIPAARTAEQVAFDSWREVGADAVVFATATKTGNTLTVQVRLFDVRGRRSVFAKEYSDPRGSNARLIAHTIADEIHQQQRSLMGVARTKLTFVSDRVRERLTTTVQDRSAKEVYMADYDGANERRITSNRQLNGWPTWSPDASTVLYTGYRFVAGVGDIPDIFASHLYQGRLVNLTNGRGNSYVARYSPDGRQIAFWSNRDGNPEIYVMNADGTNVRRITNHPANDSTPTWSPSGAQIAFTSDRAGGARPQIYMMNADGTGVQRLTNDESWADRPSWSPTTNEIAFTASNGPGYDIKILNLSTRQTRQITHGEGSNESPAFSPSGRHIAFMSTRAGRFQIFTVGIDGNGVRQVTRDGNNQFPAWSNPPSAPRP
jgi:TolB protein